ncbi:GntR family transcriptional regulator [Amycolatopsis sacchari]|uniref:GntR family transcriptional regulator n=1 Tax=Amycolatopsis sacchari TaxID=115433 RepID=UPI003D7625DD
MPINDASGVSPSFQVAADLRKRISRGEWKVGERLPGARALADEYGVALTTIVRATDELREQGLVETRRGTGSYVAQAPAVLEWDNDRYVRSASPGAAATDPFDRVDASIWTEAAPEHIARRLKIESGAKVSVVRYVWHVNGQPVQVSTQWEPLALTAGTPIETPVDGTKGNPSVAERFRSIGITVTAIEERTRARMPDADESRALHIGAGIPVVDIERTHLAGDLPVETADIIVRADRIVLTSIHTLKTEGGSDQ